MTLAAVTVAILATGIGAAASAGAPPVRFAALSRALIRPAVLPTAWAAYADAEERGDPAAAAAALETILAAMPEWADGHVALAWTIGQEIGSEAPDADGALGYLLDAVRRLEQPAARFARQRPSTAAELLLAAASLIEIRTADDPALEDAWQARLGEAPLDAARRLVATAARTVEDAALQQRLAFITQRSVAAVIRTGDLRRAEDVRRSALSRLSTLAPSPARDAALDALRRLGDVTDFANGRRSIDALDGDPALADVARALHEAGGR